LTVSFSLYPNPAISVCIDRVVRQLGQVQSGRSWTTTLIALLVLFVPLQTFAEQVSASSPAFYLQMLSWLERVSGQPDSLHFPPDGRPWVIVVFKSCCAPNVIAVRWAASLQERFGLSIGILGVAIDSPRSIAKVVPWMKARRALYPVLWDPNHELVQLLGVKATPAVLLLNRDGSEAYRTTWFSRQDSKTIETLIEAEVNRAINPSIEEKER